MSGVNIKNIFAEEFIDKNFLPIDIPIKNKHSNLTSIESLQDNKYDCVNFFDYSPKPPEIIPLKAKVTIIDEDSIGNIEKKELLSEEIQKQTNFKKGIFLLLELEMSLPKNLMLNEEEKLPNLDGSEVFRPSESFGLIAIVKNWFKKGSEPESSTNNQKEKPYKIDSPNVLVPKINRMALEWPLSLGSPDIRDQVELFIGGEDRTTDIVYRPNKGTIEWDEVDFFSNEKPTEGTGLFHFQAPLICLFFKNPGELYHRQQLFCDIEIKFPRILSNLHLYYYDAFGKCQNEKIQIDYKTKINSRIDIYLEECFKNRIFSPYQHLQFEGVMLEEMRIVDIVTLLTDQGFVDSDSAQLKKDGSKKIYLVWGTRIERRSKLKLWMVIEGVKSKTTRQKQLTGGHTYTTDKETGNMTIYMRGEMEGDGPRLYKVMNTIQGLLKERFYFVGTIE